MAVRGYSQDEILLLAGRTLKGKIEKIQGDSVYYIPINESKIQEINKFDVFSVTDSMGSETVLYVWDTLIGNDLQVEEMRLYVYGREDARKGYEPRGFAFLGGACGLVGGAALGKSPFVLLVPIVTYLGVWPFLKPTVDIRTARDKRMLDSQFYIDGYGDVSLSKKKLRVLWGSLVGTVAGAGAYHAADRFELFED